MTTLFCRDTPGLKLGPGLPGSDDCIVFIPAPPLHPGEDSPGGYATLDPEDPKYSLKLAWTHTFGCPPIVVLDDDEVRSDDPNAVLCPVCNAAFESDKKVRGHILGAHRPK